MTDDLTLIPAQTAERERALEVAGMKDTAESAARSDTAPVRNPAVVYLDRLSSPGRRSMRRELNCAVSIFTDGDVTDASAFDWSQMSQRHVKKLRSALADRGAAPTTVNHMLSGIRGTMHEAWKLRLVDDKTRLAIEDEPNETPQQRDPTARNEKPRRRSARCVATSEVRLLFAALATDLIGARDAAMLTLLYGAGLRRSEAVALQLADYDQDTGAITVRRGDGTTKGRVRATNGGKAALDSWLELRGYHPGTLLEPVIKGGTVVHRAMTDQAVMMRVRYLAKQAGLDPLTPDDLRLSFRTEQLRRQLVARKKGTDADPPVTEMLPVPYRRPR